MLSVGALDDGLAAAKFDSSFFVSSEPVDDASVLFEAEETFVDVDSSPYVLPPEEVVVVVVVVVSILPPC